MEENRRPTRHLDAAHGPSRASTVDSPRVATADSGLRSMTGSGLSTTSDSRATNGTSSSLSRDTPINDHEDGTRKADHYDKPIRIRPTSVLGNHCYEQAYVSYVDHPSAFFIQLAQFADEFTELDTKINEYYSKNPKLDPSVRWKRGDYCIAKYKDDKFYRARIIETPEVTKKPNLYDVVFLDFGNWDKVASTDLHTLLREFSLLSAQAIPCSLTKTLPLKGTWLDDPRAIKVFEDLVLDKHVDATFYRRSSRDHWQLIYVDLCLSSSKLNIRQVLKESNVIREVPNEEIYPEFNHLLRKVDMLIYGIRHEEEENDDDDDQR